MPVLYNARGERVVDTIELVGGFARYFRFFEKEEVGG